MILSRRHFCAVSVAGFSAPSVLCAQSSSGATLVELFTSQGCSSCPPADALMVKLTEDAGMIPLTYPVEIWDYLGWKDTLAKPAFTRRQKAYAAMVSGKRVYTPQAIVNGRASCVGSDLQAIRKLRRGAANTASILFSRRIESDAHILSLTISGVTTPARLLFLPVSDRQIVPIGRGENSGRTITYAHVVRDIADRGPVENGTMSITIAGADLAASGADGFALIVQAGSLEAPGEVFGAAYFGPDAKA